MINLATSPTYTATIPGAFKVLVTSSNGCFAFSNTINVTYLNPNIIALGPTTLCQGGSVVLQATSGAGFQYTWMKNGNSMYIASNSSTFTVTSPGSYMVKIVTPGGCVMYSNTINVSFIPNPTASISAQGPMQFCPGGSVTLTAANNANPVNYQWQFSSNMNGPWSSAGGVSTGQNYTATQTGYYRVVISNQLCPTTSSVISNFCYIWVFPLPPTPTISASTLIIGPGGSSTLTTISGMASYQWEQSPVGFVGGNTNTYTTPTAGTFRVKVSNIYGCFKLSNWITIGSSMMPEQGVMCLSDGIHIKHREGLPQGGTWYREMENGMERVSSVYNATENEWVLFGIDEGNFVYATDEDGQVNKWLRITDLCGPKSIVVYPNPTNNVVYVKGLDDSEKFYELHDLMGRVVAVGNLSSAQNAIDMSNLASGTYRLVLQGYGVIAIVKE